MKTIYAFCTGKDFSFPFKLFFSNFKTQLHHLSLLFFSITAYFENDKLDPTESTQYLPWIQNNCNVEGIDFPISLPQIRKFVDIKPVLDLKITIWFDLEGTITPWIRGYKHPDMPGSNEISLYLAYPSNMDGVVLMDGHFMLVQGEL